MIEFNPGNLINDKKKKQSLQWHELKQTRRRYNEYSCSRGGLAERKVFMHAGPLCLS
jgi:hypothetical protein